MPAFDRLVVEGLSLRDLHQLLQERLGLVLPLPTLRTVHETAQGNPFFALELARALDQGGVAGAIVRVPDSLHELVAARVRTVPTKARTALLAAAALADPTLALIGAVAGDDSESALGPAVEAELVTIVGGRVRFTHPLLAAAAYSAAGPAERRSVHAALATRVRPEERARHLALAASGPERRRCGCAGRSGEHGARPRGAERGRGTARGSSSIDSVGLGRRSAPPDNRGGESPLRGG